MTYPILTRAQAHSGGLKTFFTGRPCKHGHLVPRYTSSGSCCSCANRVGFGSEDGGLVTLTYRVPPEDAAQLQALANLLRAQRGLPPHEDADAPTEPPTEWELYYKGILLRAKKIAPPSLEAMLRGAARDGVKEEYSNGGLRPTGDWVFASRAAEPWEREAARIRRAGNLDYLGSPQQASVKQEPTLPPMPAAPTGFTLPLPGAFAIPRPQYLPTARDPLGITVIKE